jgi:ribosome maturation factor RimP
LDINICKEILKPFLDEHNLTFYSVGYVKEFGENILRVIVDSKEGIDLDTLGQANEYLSERLDKYDQDMDNYLLEVSSRGAERTLDNDDEINEAIGKYIHVELENMIYEGYLLKFCDDVLEVKINIKGRIKNIKINKNEIKLVRLAVKI